jgi:Uma2 family endonuclease
VLSPTNVLEPDLLYVARENLGLLTDKNAQGAPDLVVEVLSDSTRGRDQGIKRTLYERFGVREYWVADPILGTITVYRRSGRSLRREAELSADAGDTLTTPLLPSLEIPLRRVFA